MDIPLNYILGIQTDVTGAKQFTTVLEQAKLSAKRFGIETSESAKLASLKVSESIDKQNKTFKTFNAVLIDGNRRVRTSFRQTADGIKPIGANLSSVGASAKKSRPFIDNFVKALRRVAIVVPVWLLFRGALMGVLQTVREGATYWLEFDKSMQRSKQVIHGFTGDVENAVDILDKRIRRLSFETGKSMKELSDTFYQFGTVGTQFEEAMQGMETATKLATTIFGNSEKTAKVLALAYRLLGDTIDSTVPEEEKMAVISAQIYKLWKTNAFTLDEFNESLAQFLPTANAFNIGMSESLALLATLNTASLKAGRGGRTLRQSINKLVENLDKASVELGVYFNPATDDAFDALMKVLGAVKQLQNQGADIKELSSVMRDIFGGVRSREAGLALIAIYDTLLQNLKDVNLQTGEYKTLLGELDIAYGGVLDSVSMQAERTDNLRKILGETFVKGIVGGKDFNETLKQVNLTMQASIPYVELLGKLFRGLFDISMKGQPLGWLTDYYDTLAKKSNILSNVTNKLAESYKRAISVDELKKLISEIEGEAGFIMIEAGYDTGKLLYDLEGLLYILEEEAKKKPVEVPVELGGEEFAMKEGKIIAKLKTDTEAKISLIRKETEYMQELLRGASTLEISERRITDFVKEKVKQYNQLDDIQQGSIPAIKEQEVISLALKGNYEELKGLFVSMRWTDEEILQIEKQRQELAEDQYKDIESSTQSLVSHELDLLKLRGASEAEILRAEISLRESLGLYDSQVDRLQDQLKLEKEITEEKLGQKNLSADTIKLWEIAQRYGKGIATEIGEVLSNQKSINELSARASRIFEKQYSSIFKQFKAGEFFFGGRGAEIPIPERTTADINQMYNRIAERLRYEVAPHYDVPVSVQFNVNLAGIETKVKNAVTEAVRRELKLYGLDAVSRDYFDKPGR
ncbi:MAG: phage tail tape measure protein [Fusobacteriaceae bacterium]|nr:phage tail tape measure protein [Fusobacteriaceae bacterium]